MICSGSRWNHANNSISNSNSNTEYNISESVTNWICHYFNSGGDISCYTEYTSICVSREKVLLGNEF